MTNRLETCDWIAEDRTYYAPEEWVKDNPEKIVALRGKNSIEFVHANTAPERSDINRHDYYAEKENLHLIVYETV